MSNPTPGFVHIDKCFGRVGFQTFQSDVDNGGELSNFDECLFVVTPMLSYDAAVMSNTQRRRGEKFVG